MSKIFTFSEAVDLINSLAYGKYLKASEPKGFRYTQTQVRFHCTKCNSTFTKLCARVVRGSKGCHVCRENFNKQRRMITPEEYHRRLATKGKTHYRISRKTPFKADTELKHVCDIHDRAFMATPRSMAGNLNCPDCARANRFVGGEKRSQATLHERKQTCLAAIKRHGRAILLDKDFRPNKPTSARCLTHDQVWDNVIPMNLAYGHGLLCCKLDVVTSNRYQRKEYKGRVVQGYEPFGINHLCKERHYSMRDIQAGAGQKVPVVNYEFQGKKRCYLPDMYIPKDNILVEVKSVQSLGLYDKETWLTVKAKGHAAVKSGFNYLMLLFNAKGKRIVMPKGWQDMTYTQIRKLLLD